MPDLPSVTLEAIASSPDPNARPSWLVHREHPGDGHPCGVPQGEILGAAWHVGGVHEWHGAAWLPGDQATGAAPRVLPLAGMHLETVVGLVRTAHAVEVTE